MSSEEQQTQGQNLELVEQIQKQQPTNQDIVLQTNRWQQAETQPISRINKYTPLVFKLSIGQTYYISYRSNFSKRFIPQLFAIGGAGVAVIISTQYVTLPLWAELSLIGLVISSILLFLVLSFLDGGTLFEDQQQNFQNDRIYCSICGLYRHQTTRHCSFCNKCVRGYDHHCSFFGKCIGSRNIIFFYLFSFGSSFTIICCFIGLIYGIISANSTLKNTVSN